VLARQQRVDHDLAVGPALGHHRDRVDVGGEHLLGRRDRAVQLELLVGLGGALRQHVGHDDGRDVRMQLPQPDEAPGELSGSDDTDLHLLVSLDG
jgi:hypothetical protein